MHLKHCILILVLSLIQAIVSQSQTVHLTSCKTISTRKEIRDLTPTQLSRFINATLALHKVENSFYQKQSDLHLEYSGICHGTPAFLPWHRQYIRSYEIALQEIDPGIMLPYWDWSIDSQSPERSKVLSPSYFGGNGVGPERCVSNGPFANWKFKSPDSHCLRREYDEGSLVSPFYAPEALEIILSRSKDYNQFRERIETAPHARVHAGLGGKVGDIQTMYSPNDPIFFLHHTFVDMLWWEWQTRNKQIAFSYNGYSNVTDPTTKVNREDVLTPFNVKVKDVLDIRGPGFCYNYPKYQTKLPQFKKLASNPPANPNPNKSNFGNSRIVRRQLLSGLNSSDDEDGLFGGVARVVTTVTEVVTTPKSDKSTSLVPNLTRSVTDAVSNIVDGITDVLGIDGLLEGLDLGNIFEVDGRDRTSKHKIRKATPIAPEFLVRNKLDPERANKFCNEMNTLMAAINTHKDFKPKADLL